MSDQQTRRATCPVGTVLRERDTGGVVVAIHPAEGGVVCADQFYDAKTETTRVRQIAFEDIGLGREWVPINSTTHQPLGGNSE